MSYVVLLDIRNGYNTVTLFFWAHFGDIDLGITMPSSLTDITPSLVNVSPS
jgi:hypothetical protein